MSPGLPHPWQGSLVMRQFLYLSLMFQATEEIETEEIYETATASVTQTAVNFSAVLVLCCVKKLYKN